MMETNRRLIAEYTRQHGGGSNGRIGNGVLATLMPHVLAPRPQSLADYGCGRSDLARLVAARADVGDVAVFDPAVPERAKRPARVLDLSINVDVLEHVPDEEIDAVAAEMASMARDVLIMVDTRPAEARLSDGRDAQMSLHDEAWWWERLRRSVRRCARFGRSAGGASPSRASTRHCRRSPRRGSSRGRPSPAS